MSVSAAPPVVRSYALYTQKGQEKRAVSYLKGLRKTYTDIVDAVMYPFRCYVRLDVAFHENSNIKDLKLGLPKDVKAKIEGMAGIIRICGHGDEAVPVNQKI